MEFKVQSIKIDGGKLRQARGKLTQLKVMEDTGIHHASISTYEKEQCVPPGDVLATLCLFYGVSIEDVIRSNNPAEYSRNISIAA